MNSICVESRVVSYLAARPSRDLVVAGNQQVTREWWETRRGECELFVSDVVVAECAAGDPSAASERAAYLAGLPVLKTTEESEDLAEALLIVVLPEYDFVTLWESTKVSSLVDLDTNVPRKGVQLVQMSSRVEDYAGEIAVRQLEDDPIDQHALGELMEFRREVEGREYEQDKIELIKAAYDGPLGRNAEDLTSLFCSELVAEAYQRLGLPNEEKPSNEYTPADFSSGRQLGLLKGKLGEEIFLQY